jgi:deoxyribodipyrimidine photo-lyase
LQRKQQNVNNKLHYYRKAIFGWLFLWPIEKKETDESNNDLHCDMNSISIFWFRRDLRLDDNTGLFSALNKGFPVLPIFIFDTAIIHELPSNDRRITFIYRQLEVIKQAFQFHGGDLMVLHGTPIEMFNHLLSNFDIKQVFTNHDTEPYAIQRDQEIESFLASKQIEFHTFKDQVIFEKAEVVKEDGTPYTVYTPYSKKWKSLLTDNDLQEYPSQLHLDNVMKLKPTPMPSYHELGFEEQLVSSEISENNNAIIARYHETRDYPAILGTTRLGIHLRFGTISIRKLVKEAKASNEKFLNELIWREFYQAILWHFPHVVHQSFKSAYDEIQWRNNESEFKAWCEGRTGYPIVDAGMRELNATGWMHNRVRMIVASFLTKHLLIDWRWGEAYFATHLLDFDLASNNGGWQWAAGCGVDAAPYFRIFNPALQTQKFDGQLKYIHQWIPELNSFDYPQPIVDHQFARQRCLETYKKALQS